MPQRFEGFSRSDYLFFPRGVPRLSADRNANLLVYAFIPIPRLGCGHLACFLLFTRALMCEYALRVPIPNHVRLLRYNITILDH